MRPMKTKPIKVDWEALEDAFNTQEEDLVSYLDCVTGHVVLDGEGEETEDDLDDESARYGPGAAPSVPEFSANDSTRAYVVPPDAEQKIEWMRMFLDEELEIDPAITSELRRALTVDDAADELCSILNRHPQVRDEWYRFRADRLHEEIDGWLEDHGIVPVDPPPWRR
jgi:hypothetical protein